MRTSGGRGHEGWILVIPVAAMLVAVTMTNGGAHAMLISLDAAIREAVTGVANFVVNLL